jgi:hypothetical protein
LYLIPCAGVSLAAERGKALALATGCLCE